MPENRILESAALPHSPIAPDRNVVLLPYMLTGIIISFLFVGAFSLPFIFSR